MVIRCLGSTISSFDSRSWHSGDTCTVVGMEYSHRKMRCGDGGVMHHQWGMQLSSTTTNVVRRSSLAACGWLPAVCQSVAQRGTGRPASRRASPHRTRCLPPCRCTLKRKLPREQGRLGCPPCCSGRCACRPTVGWYHIVSMCLFVLHIDKPTLA